MAYLPIADSDPIRIRTVRLEFSQSSWRSIISLMAKETPGKD